MKIKARYRSQYVNMFRKYLEEFGSEYSSDSREFMEREFLKLTKPGETPDILLQLYAKFGMLSDEENIYLRFSEIIGQTYGWNRNILEVGGGYYPIFSKYIDDKQQQHGGTITTVDPKIVTKKLGNIKLQKREFSSEEDVSKFDLILGICPCEATTEIIKSAVLNDKEFFIAMCGCVHLEYELPWFYSRSLLYHNWLDNVVDLAEEQKERGFDVSIDQVSYFPYPIIKSKRKK